jgi:hypothetical protein
LQQAHASALLSAGLLQVVWRETCVLRNLLQGYRAELYVLVPRPGEIRPPRPLKLYVGAPFLFLGSPADSKKGAIHPTCLGARPRAHTKLMDFGGFFSCSV